MTQSRIMDLKKLYLPCPVKENDEIFRNGVFHFNISKILEDIHCGKLAVGKEYIEIKEWFKWHGHHSSLDEGHLPTVNIESIIIQAEIDLEYFLSDQNENLHGQTNGLR